MSEVQRLLEDISKSFPSSHKVREYLESGEEQKIDASELYLRQKHFNYGLSPEDEANLEMLLDITDESDPRIKEIYESYQDN